MSPTRTTAKLDEAPVAMLNVDAVRQLLGGISRTTAYRLIRTKQLKAGLVGKRPMVAPADLAEYQRKILGGK